MMYEPETPRDEAQELMWEAMEARTDERAIALSRRALAIYPDCVDAIAMLTDLESEWVKDYIEGMRKAVAAGRRDLGARFFKQHKGVFWGLIETRPFMRAMAALVEGLLATTAPQDTEEAIEIMEEMLALNPNDNQGMRYVLIGCYFERKRYEAAEGLLRKYKKDGMAVFWWARVLMALVEGREEKAEGLLKGAREENRYVLNYLSGKKRRPREGPEYYSRGSEEEAVICANLMWRGWRAHPKAMRWVKERAGVEKGKRGRAGEGGG